VRIGIDVQVVAEGNRSGLYTHLRYLIGELRKLESLQVSLLVVNHGSKKRTLSSKAEISKTFDGASSFVVRPIWKLYRLWHSVSKCNRVDVLMHNLHGALPPATRAANVYLVPDVIPLGFDYGPSEFVNHYASYYSTALKHGDAIIVSSEHTKQDFLNRVGGEPELIYVCPLAAAPNFVPRSRDSLLPVLEKHSLATKPYVLLVSTIEKRKNHVALLRAFHQVVSRDSALPHKLVFVGKKWVGNEEVFDLVRTLGLGDRFVYLGFADELSAIYAGADAFVFRRCTRGLACHHSKQWRAECQR
jgi:glycosyltransferase involved in cell wall biosynthesis